MLKISRLTVENMETGCVTDNPQPRVSYCLESDRQNVTLKKAVISIGDWKKETDCQIAVPYEGSRLQPFTKYAVRVEAEDDAGERAWASTEFETGRMDTIWSGRWITDGEYRFKEAKISPKTMTFRTRFSCEKEIASARLYVTALGIYELLLNGEKVGQDYFAPGFTSYRNQLQYQTYDVTDMLNDRNELLAVVGGGWAVGSFTYKRRNRVYAKRQALLGELRILYTDGTGETIGTNEEWEVTEEGNYKETEFYNGEVYDATVDLEKISWKKASFEQVKIHPKIMAQYGAPVRAHEEFRPVQITRAKSGMLIYDFGQNFAGVIHAAIRGRQGQKVEFRHAEILMDGELYTEPLRTAKQEAVYICKDGEQTYSPKMTYMGFRYVGVRGIEEDQLELTALALYSDVEDNGNFSCSNELINQLQNSIRWGAKSNFVDIPTDCPQRDERMGWTGDTQVFSGTACYLADTYAFYRKYLYDLYKEQLIAGGMVPEVVPTFGPSKCSCAWGDAACIVPWNVYLFSGDAAILEQQFDSMKAWVDYIRKVDGEHHGWRHSFHYGDWLALDRVGAAAGNVYGATDEGYIADIYYAASAELTAKAAAVLGRKEEEKQYREIAEKQWRVVKEEYFTPTGRCAEKTQTGLLLALKYHLSEDEELTREMLKKLFRESRNKLNTGFVGTSLLCNVLTDNGMTDTAYRLLLNEEYPGWLHEVKLGATTVWERWNSLDEDGKISSTGMNSLNHYSYGAILEWMFRHVGGIHLLEESPGGRRVAICPNVHYDLRRAEAVYDSAVGQYACSWEIMEDNRIRIKITIPFGGEGEVRLPHAPEILFEDKTNPLFATVVNGICYITAGNYEVVYEATEKLKKIYSVESKLEDLLNHPQIRAFLSTMTEVDMIPDAVYGLSFRQVAEMFSGPMDEGQTEMLNTALSQY